MLTLETINSRSKTCQKCGGVFKVIDCQDRVIQEKLLQLRSTKHIVPFIKILRQATNCDVRDAKGTFMHYVDEIGKCHRCKTKIQVDRFVDCPNCKSLNIHPLV